MNIHTLKALLIAATLMVASASAHAQVKMGIVDLRKVFDGYYKTREADTKIKGEASELEKTAKGMLEDYRKSNEDIKGLVEAAGDSAISTDEKQKRRKAADKLLEIRNLEQQVQQYQRQSEATLLEKRKRMRDQILSAKSARPSSPSPRPPDTPSSWMSPPTASIRRRSFSTPTAKTT